MGFVTSQEENGGLLNDYIEYFEEKNRAGVVRVGDSMMGYLLPMTVLGIRESLSNDMNNKLSQSMGPVLLLIIAAHNGGPNLP